MNFKKRVNGSWTDTPHYIHNTSTDTITTLPAVIYANDTTATVGLKGNMVQSGTPTTDNPIQPQETGDKTANLSPESTLTNSSTVDTRIYFQIRILYYNDNTYLGASEITNFRTTGYKVVSFNIDSENCNKLRIVHNGETRNIVFEEIAGVFSGDYTISFNCINNDPTTINGISLSNVMLNTGSTALPYEPYGYKIPILSGGTTTPVYLGEVESTRQIKKYEFTGEENISDIGDYYNTNVSVLSVAWSVTTSTTGGFQINNSGNRIWAIKSNFSSYATAADFKTYLQQQYAAGTPVTIWYVLATPQTAVVNEPLRKIGTYADEVSGISIPTIAGANTISVDTTLQPSEVTVNYKGWHPVSAVHERDNGAWT